MMKGRPSDHRAPARYPWTGPRTYSRRRWLIMGTSHFRQKAITRNAVGVNRAAWLEHFWQQARQVFSMHLRGHIQLHVPLAAHRADKPRSIFDRRIATVALFLSPLPGCMSQCNIRILPLYKFLGTRKLASAQAPIFGA